MNFKKINRKIHYWGAVICSVPVIIVIVTGLLLLVKKDFDWIQPSTDKGQGTVPTVKFEDIIGNLRNLADLNVVSWDQIKRIDVRPDKGILKVQVEGNWEVQMDHQTGEVLRVSFRRSDVIESIHDGSFFHDLAKKGLFLPSAIVLLILWITGVYLFTITELSKQRSRTKRKPLK